MFVYSLFLGIFIRPNIFFILLALSFVSRFFLATVTTGFIHPDEHFQMIEPAFGLWKGYWLQSWEWRYGMRSMIPPLIIAQLMKITSIFPWDWHYSLRLFFAFWSCLIPYWGGRLSFSYLTYPYQILYTALLSFWWIFLSYSTHPLSEALCTPFLVGHIYYLFSFLKTNRQQYWHLIMSALLLSMAFIFRPQTLLWGLGIFFAFALLMKEKKEMRKPFFLFFAVYAFIIFLFGFYDLITKGVLFSSLIEYTRWNLVEGVMSQRFGAHPWYRYLSTFWRTLTFPLLVVVLGGFFYAKKIIQSIQKQHDLSFIFIPCCTFFLFHTLLSHKEDRFLYPLWPFIFFLVIYLLQYVLRRSLYQKRLLLTFTFLCLVFNTEKIFRHQWNAHGDIQQQSEWIRSQSSIKNLLVWGRPLGHTGGYGWLRRPIPYKVWDESSWKRTDFPYHLIGAPYQHLQLEKDAEFITAQLKKQGTPCTHIKDVFYECSKK
jgi:phosphatidylinositol glycan class B